VGDPPEASWRLLDAPEPVHRLEERVQLEPAVLDREAWAKFGDCHRRGGVSMLTFAANDVHPTLSQPGAAPSGAES
jgi:hypothetical protein